MAETNQLVECSATMETIPLSELVFVDTATVSSDGRLYIGREYANKSVKIVVIDEERDED